jgi:hypothetical protein
MAEVESLTNIVSWSRQDEMDLAAREEFETLVNGRSMLYAPVSQPKSFVADMKSHTGRLMDFNKGM